MRELKDIVRAWKGADESSRMVLATVVAIQGSAYRRPGAHLLILNEHAFGSVSGGCLEADLLQTAWDRTHAGPVLATFDTTSDEDALLGYGLGCRGIVTVLLRRVGPLDQGLELCARHLAGREPTCIATRLTGANLGHVSKVQADAVSDSTEELFIERLEPVLSLHIYGAGFDTPPFAAISHQLGWDIQVYDHRGPLLVPERFPSETTLVSTRYTDLNIVSDRYSAHVVMTHSFGKDLDVLSKLADVKVGYLGVLGPRSRTDRLLNQLGLAGSLPNIHSPIGLNIGAEGPDQIALSVAAEIQAVFAGADGASLSRTSLRPAAQLLVG